MGISDNRWCGSAGRAAKRLLVLAVLLLLAGSRGALAAETVCAQVKIEIKQELTLERQAFDAEMKINNGLDTSAITNVEVNVKFTDGTGAPVRATSDATNADART